MSVSKNLVNDPLLAGVLKPPARRCLCDACQEAPRHGMTTVEYRGSSGALLFGDHFLLVRTYRVGEFKDNWPEMVRVREMCEDGTEREHVALASSFRPVA